MSAPGFTRPSCRASVSATGTVAGVYRPADGQLKDVEGAGGVSAIDAPSSTRALEATFANGWFNTITGEVFG